MANLFGRTRPIDEARSVPTGDTIGSYTSYLDAQKAVDYLADQKFPVQLVSIVGNDLKMVERVTGKLSYPRVALSGALTGAWFGLFIGVLLSFFSTAPQGAGSYLSVGTSVLMGAAFWMLFAIVGYAAQRGKRDFTSTSQVLASSYDVIVAPEAASEARRLLSQLPMGSQAVRPPSYQSQLHQPPANQTPPARPQGWHDPYAAPAAAEPAAPEAPAEAPATPPPGTYHDLPDGRPQYGIRVEPAAPAEPVEAPQPPAAAAEAPQEPNAVPGDKH
ncbi:general stress protein [Arthrobacter sp. 35W]|uniref:general stress protein n=1 Tax=Arthrobacter sp. 35W TaxID=1132441 RepID=UPI0004041F1F|nr:general stress protein [Arthrobacter sp. 35W]